MNRPKHFSIYPEIELRELSQRRAGWAPVPELLQEIPRGSHRFRPLREEPLDLARVAELMRASYPALRGSTLEFLHQPEGYRWLFDERPRRRGREGLCIVGEYADRGELTGALVLEMNRINLSVFLTALAIHPQCRRERALNKGFLFFCDEYLAACGIEYASAHVTTNHPLTQRVLCKLGYAIRGIIPGATLYWAGVGEKYRRDSVVILDKFFNGAERLVSPQMSLIPGAARLWESIQQINRREGR